MTNFNDFLKTRAGFAYVRECVKCGISIHDATDKPGVDLYKVDIRSRWSHISIRTGFLFEVLELLRNLQFATCVIREYNRDTHEYKVVYNGAAGILHDWFTLGFFSTRLVLIEHHTVASGKNHAYVVRLHSRNDCVHAMANAANHYAQIACFFPGNMDKPLFNADAGFMMDWHNNSIPF